MAGRHPKLTHGDLRRIDAWWAERKWSATVMARMLAISRQTLYDAAKRCGGYAGCSRG